MSVIEILNEENEVINTIFASEEYAEATYPGRWRFDPCSLYAVVSYSHKYTNANESISGNLIEEDERPD